MRVDRVSSSQHYSWTWPLLAIPCLACTARPLHFCPRMDPLAMEGPAPRLADRRAALRTYFVYLLDRNGHIVIRREVDADDDEMALALARHLLASQASYPAAE